jgi:hypothetical protein
MIRRIVPFIAVLLVAFNAHAGAVLDGTDDRIDVGTLSTFGSSVKASSGWTLMCGLKTTRITVQALLAAFTTGAEGVVGSFSQSIFFHLSGYTTDFANDQDHVLLDAGDVNDAGWLWHQEVAANSVSNDVLNRHIATVIATGNSGANNNSGATIVWYVNNTAYTSWTKPFSDGLGTVTNYGSTLAIGAERKNGGSWFNWAQGTFADCRVYTRALTANEVNEINLLNGRDSITNGLLRRWPLQGFCQETQTGDTCTPQNGPTFTTTNELDGVRRRS